MSILKITIQIGGLVSALALPAATFARFPTQRPLPQRIQESDPEWIVRRDDEFHNQFYVAPRMYSVFKQTISEDRSADLNCAFVENFIQGMNAISETILKLSTSVSLQADFVKNQMVTLSNEQKTYTETMSSLEEALTRATTESKPAIEAELLKAKSQLRDTELRFEAARKKKSEIDQMVAEIDVDLQNRLNNLSQIRKEIHRPVAQLRLNLELPPDPTKNVSVRNRLGFDANDQVSLSEIISLDLQPRKNLAEEERGEDRADNREFNRVFEPKWSKDSFELNSVLLNVDRYGFDLVPSELPRQIDFERTLTLRNFCNIRAQKVDLTKDVIEALSVAYSLPIWSDSGSARLNGARVFSHQIRLKEEALQALKRSVVLNRELEFNEQDLGDPLRFSGEGSLKSENVLMNIQMKKKTEENP